MPDHSPILLWLRRDLRLADNPALHAAAASGRPVIPVFVLDEVVESHGAAPKWRLGLGVEHFAKRLEGIGSRLILRRGRAAEAIAALARETGADTVICTRAYDPASRERDAAVEAALAERGARLDIRPGHLLFEPGAVATQQGGYYKVYTPFWRAVKGRDPGAPLDPPSRLEAPAAWPESDALDDWALGAAMNRGAAVTARYVHVGEEAAQDRLAAFTSKRIADYARTREIPGIEGSSRLGENLTYGEISVRTAWHAGQRALHDGAGGAETFLQELVWRDFAYHLLWHTPRLLTGNWRPDWDAFPWNEDEARADVLAWKQGRTGIRFVDAAMRQIYTSGFMHNRARMIVASYLTKNLLTHWKIGMRWFEDCLVDWDVANNSLGWQWSAGSGPDATPYFRVFNPVTQLDRFDRDRAYVSRWIAEGQADPPADALAFFEAIPRRWALAPSDPYPEPIVGPKEGRERALEAYAGRGF